MFGAFKTVRRTERRETGVAFLVLFLVLASHTILETARDALFLTSVAPERLPLVYIALAFVALIVAELHARVGAASGRRALATTSIAGGAVTILFWIASASRATWVLYLLYVWPALITTLVVLQFWTLLGDALTITQAKRTYGAIGVGSVAGGIAGAAVASWMSAHQEPRHLLLVAAVGLPLAGISSLTITRHLPESRPSPESLGLAEGARYVAGQPYARNVLIVAVLASAAVTLLDYLFKSTVAARVDAAQLGAFFAAAYLVFNSLSLLAQLFLASFAVRRLGVPGAAAVLPAALFAAVLLTLVLPLLPAVLLLRGVDGGLRHSVHRTAFELMTIPLPSHARGWVKRVLEVIGARGGQALASLAILGLVLLPEPTLAIIGCLIALAGAWLVGALVVRRSYVELFRHMVGEGRVSRLKQFPELDAASLESVIAALDSDDDSEVIAAIEVLDRDQKSHLVPKLLLFHPSEEVARRVLSLFARRKRKSAIAAIDRLLAHSTSGPLRAAALPVRASLRLDAELLDEPGVPEEVRGAAAVCRAAFLRAPTAPAEALAQSASPATREAIAEAIAATGCVALTGVLKQLARDSVQKVSAAAIAAMGRLRGDEIVRDLVELMRRTETRGAARHELVSMGEPALDVLAQALADTQLGPVRRELGEVIAEMDPERGARILVHQLGVESDGLIRYRLIRSLEGIVARHPGVDLDHHVLHRTIGATIDKAYRYLAYENALEESHTHGVACSTAGCRLLRRLLRDKRQHAVNRLFRLLGLAIPSESFAAAYRGIRSESAQQRASAIELVDNVLPRELRVPVLGLVDDLSARERLERAGPHGLHERVDHEEVLRRLLSGSVSTTLREAADYHAAELARTKELHAQ